MSREEEAGLADYGAQFIQMDTRKNTRMHTTQKRDRFDLFILELSRLLSRIGQRTLGPANHLSPLHVCMARRQSRVPFRDKGPPWTPESYHLRCGLR